MTIPSIDVDLDPKKFKKYLVIILILLVVVTIISFLLFDDESEPDKEAKTYEEIQDQNDKLVESAAQRNINQKFGVFYSESSGIYSIEYLGLYEVKDIEPEVILWLKSLENLEYAKVRYGNLGNDIREYDLRKSVAELFLEYNVDSTQYDFSDPIIIDSE